jgi:hypothetical protein
MVLRPFPNVRIAGRVPFPAIFVFLSIIAGCATKWPDDYPARFEPVTGTITLEDKPLEHVQVTFVPTREGGVLATGETDASGKYRLSYYKSTGTPAGEYRAILSYRTDPKGVPITKAMNSSLLVPREVSQAIQRLPERYATKDSVLKATVRAGENVIDFSIEGPLKPNPQ